MNLNYNSLASCYRLLVESNISPPIAQWFGEGEKYVKAVFSLASKIAPTIVFVDEVSCSIPSMSSSSAHIGFISILYL